MSRIDTLTEDDLTGLLELIDGAYGPILAMTPESPAQKEWQEKWIKKAAFLFHKIVGQKIIY